MKSKFGASVSTIEKNYTELLNFSLLVHHVIQYSGTPPCGHLGNTVTSLLRPLFLAARQNGHKLSCKKNLVNTAIFFVTLVTVLTGFHWSKKIRNEPPWDGRPLTLKSGTLTTEWRSLFGIQANWYSSNSTKYWTFKRAQFRLNTPSEYNWWFLAFRTFRSSRSLLLGSPPSFLAALPLAPYVSSRSTVSDLKEK